MSAFKGLNLGILEKEYRVTVTSIISGSIESIQTLSYFEHDQFAPIIESFNQSFPVKINIKNVDRAKIFHTLEGKNIGKTPISALAAVSISKVSNSVQKFEHIRAWAFLVVLGITKNGAELEFIRRFCARIRLLTQPEYFELLRLLPEFNKPLSATLIELSELYQHLKEIENHTLASKVSEIHTSIYYFLNNKEWEEEQIKNAESSHKKQGVPILRPTANQQYDDFKFDEFIDNEPKNIAGVPSSEIVGDNISDCRTLQLHPLKPSNLDQQFSVKLKTSNHSLRT